MTPRECIARYLGGGAAAEAEAARLEAALRRRLLLKAPVGIYGASPLTPLGQRVRAALEQEARDAG